MKKLLSVLFVLLFGIALVGCNTTPQYEIALITDHGPVDDRSFNQGSWEGVEAYATEHKISYKYYRPSENSGSARLEAIRLAVEAGAKVVVTPGFAFAESVFLAQSEFPDVKFILLDAQPSKDGTTLVGPNTVSIFYAEEQSGFLAGYAAVKNGFTKLGYMGGVGVPAVIRFGIGFIQGAEYAAVENNVDVTVQYKHLGNFNALPEHKTLASSWYNSGTQLIFVAAGAAINNVISAAEETTGKFVMGANVDQQTLSNVILTSALKRLKESVYQMLAAYYANDFQGGKTLTLKAADDGVGLTDDFSRYQSFTKAQYDAVYLKLVNGTINVTADHTINIASGLPLTRTTVILEN